jgi:hypothetical protein
LSLLKIFHSMALKTPLEKTLLGFYIFIIIVSIGLTFLSIYAGKEWSRTSQIVTPILPFFISIGITVLIGVLYRYKIVTLGLGTQS